MAAARTGGKGEGAPAVEGASDARGPDLSSLPPRLAQTSQKCHHRAFHKSGSISKGEERVMRARRLRGKWTVATAGVAVLGTLAAVALASPGSGFTPTTLVTANFNNTVHLNSDKVKFQTKDPTDVRVQKIVLGVNSFSGWHHHPGIVIVAVALGAVTFMNSDCSSKTYGPGLPDGAVFAEGGDDPGQATSAAGATVFATFVAPHADPSPVFRIEDAPPPCAP